MKTFTEHLAEQRELDEGIVRSGTVTTFAVRSRAAGVKAEAAYKRARSELTKPFDRDNAAERFDRIEAVLKAMLDGQRHTREQIGNHVALDFVGHLASKKPRR